MCDQISVQISERLLLRFVDVSSLLGSVSGDGSRFLSATGADCPLTGVPQPLK